MVTCFCASSTVRFASSRGAGTSYMGGGWLNAAFQSPCTIRHSRLATLIAGFCPTLLLFHVRQQARESNPVFRGYGATRLTSCLPAESGNSPARLRANADGTAREHVQYGCGFGNKAAEESGRGHHNGEFDASKAESSAAWIIDAPWAHLVWSRYVLVLDRSDHAGPEAGGWFSTCPAPGMNSSYKRLTLSGSSPRTRRSMEAATGR